jgi:hypothetical protein
VVFHATAGDAESGDTDERSVQFPDGSADDWAVEDFVLAKPKKKKKQQLPRYAVLARQGIRREAGAARNGLLLVLIVFVVFVGCCCSTMVPFIVTSLPRQARDEDRRKNLKKRVSCFFT